jgi:hypothetical protein
VSVILKETLGADAQTRLRHESRILERQAGIEGVPQIASMLTVDGSIVVLDVAGASLSGLHENRPFELYELARLHSDAKQDRRGVAHVPRAPAKAVS